MSHSSLKPVPGANMKTSPDLALANKPQRIRQDRYRVTGENLYLKVSGWDQRFDILDYSASGISIVAFTEHLNFEKLTNPQFEIYFDGIEIQKLSAHLVRHESVKGDATKMSYRFTSGILNIDCVEAALQSQDLISKIESYEKELEKIPEAFIHYTLSLRDSLSHLRDELRKVDAQLSSKTELHGFMGVQTFLAKSLARSLKPKIDKSVARLSDVLMGQSEESIRSSYEFFRKELSQLVYESPFSERSLSKPLGYAGDYELMNMLYRSEPLGTELFAKVIHFYIIDMPGGRAVRNRAEYMKGQIAQYLEKNKFQATFLSVASGPAYEVQLVLEEFKKHDLSGVTFCLLDQDAMSLKFAQRKLIETTLNFENPPNFEFLNTNIKSLFRNGLSGRKFDLIYSAGLFDYFSDPVAGIAARILYESVNENGKVIIGNFDVTSPSRFFMEMAWDWNLVYRSEMDLRRLFGDLSKDIYIDKEASGVNLFCNIPKGMNGK